MRHRFWLFLAFSVYCGLASPLNATAQLPVTQLNTVFPPGGQQGSEFDVAVVDGTDLDELSGLVFNHPGIQQMLTPDPLTNPKTFRVKIAPEVPAGYYSIRAQGRFGVSNARMFRIDQAPAQTEQALSEQKLTPNNVVYGTIESARQVDTFQVDLPAGASVGLTVDSLALDSPMRPCLEVYSPAGRRVAFSRRVAEQDPRLNVTTAEAGPYSIRVFDQLFQGSKSHVYRLEISDTFVPVEIAPGAGPLDAMPPTLVWHSPGNIESDRQIQPEQLQSMATVLPGFLSPRRSYEALKTVTHPFSPNQSTLAAIAQTPIACVDEQEPNNEFAADRAIALPVHIRGRFQTGNDIDRYAVPIVKGTTISLEVFAERDGSLLDPVVTAEQVVTAADGKQTVKAVKLDEDLKTNLLPQIFDTISDDVSLLWTADTDCLLRITVQNRYSTSQALSQQAYRLVVKQAQPHFRVIALALPHVTGKQTADTPAGCVLRRNGTAQVTVLLHRLEGFSQGVTIKAERTPPGVQIPPVVIPPGQSQAVVVMHADSEAAVGMSELTLLATPRPDDGTAQPVQVGTVVSKGDQIYPAVSRLGHSLVVSVVDDILPVRARPENPPPVAHVCPTQTIAIPVTIERNNGFADKVTLTVTGIDKKSKAQIVNATADGKTTEQTAVLLKLPADSPPGWYSCQVEFATKVSHSRNPEAIERAEARLKRLTEEEQQRKQTIAELQNSLKELEAQIAAATAGPASETTEEKPGEEVDSQNGIADLQAARKQQAAELQRIENRLKEVTAAIKPQQEAIAKLKKTFAPKPIDHAGVLKSFAFQIHEAAVRLKAEPTSVAVEPGGVVKIKASIERKNNFAGPVRLVLVAPPWKPEWTMTPVMLPVGQETADLEITIPADAAKEKQTGYLLRAEFTDKNQPLGVDVPLTIEVR